MDQVASEKAKQNFKDMEHNLKVSLEKAAEIFYKKQEAERKQAEEELRLKQEREKKEFEEFLQTESLKITQNKTPLNVPPQENPSSLTVELNTELECPVCYDAMKPPRKIWQCSSGHALCGVCYINPAIKRCPTCRGKIIGRNIAMEKITAALFRKPAEKRKAPDDTFEDNVEKIFSGKEMNPAKRKKVCGTGRRIVRCANAKRGCKKLLINDKRLKEHIRRCPFSVWYWVPL